MLVRVAFRDSRCAETLGRLDDTRCIPSTSERSRKCPDVYVRIAKCGALMRAPDGTLELANDTLARAGASKSVSTVVLLERVRGYALLRPGDPIGALAALGASLVAARTRRDCPEITLPLLSLLELDRSRVVEPPSEVAKTRSLLSSRRSGRCSEPRKGRPQSSSFVHA